MNPIQKLAGIAAITTALVGANQSANAEITEQQLAYMNGEKSIVPMLYTTLFGNKTPEPPKDYLTATTEENSLYLTEVDVNNNPVGIPAHISANGITNLVDSMIGKKFLVEKAANVSGFEQGEVSYTNSDGQKVVVIDDLGNFANYFTPEDATNDLISLDYVDNKLVLSAKSIDGGEGTFSLTPIFGGPSYESTASGFGQRTDITDILNTGLPATINFNMAVGSAGYCTSRNSGLNFGDGQLLTSSELGTVHDDLECAAVNTTPAAPAYQP